MTTRPAWHGGQLVLLRDDAAPQPLLMAGNPITSVSDGFSLGTYFAALPLHLLDLPHTSGHGRHWVFSPTGEMIANDLAHLTADFRSELSKALVPLMQTLWRATTMLEADVTAEVKAFASLGQQTRLALLALCQMDEILEPTFHFLSGSQDPEDQAPGLMGLDLKLTTALLDQGFVDAARGAAATGLFTVRSPLSGALASTDISLCATEVVYWYGFRDPVRHTPFFLLATLHHCRVVALYLPETQTFVMGDHWYRDLHQTMFGHPPDVLLLRHLIAYAPQIHNYLDAPKRQLTLLYGEEHIGHHLWNELSGLDGFLAEPTPERLPAIVEMSPRSEMFGRLDKIWPSLTGKVVRFYDSRELLLAAMYEERLFLMRVTALSVKETLRDRIARVVDMESYMPPERDAHAALIMASMPVISLMLRVENRTLARQARFYIQCTRHIVARKGPVCFVIDGHERGMDGTFAIESFNQGSAASALIQAELVIADAIAAALEGTGCQVRVNIDRPLGVSLYWLRHARFFISPWGAGLAKSRWATNRPGIVVTNTSYLLEHTDLHIYDDPALNENVPLVLFATPDMITDLPDAPRLVPVASGFGSNFAVDFDRFAPLLDEMIDATL